MSTLANMPPTPRHQLRSVHENLRAWYVPLSSIALVLLLLGYFLIELVTLVLGIVTIFAELTADLSSRTCDELGRWTGKSTTLDAQMAAIAWSVAPSGPAKKEPKQ